MLFERPRERSGRREPEIERDLRYRPVMEHDDRMGRRLEPNSLNVLFWCFALDGNEELLKVKWRVVCDACQSLQGKVLGRILVYKISCAFDPFPLFWADVHTDDAYASNIPSDAAIFPFSKFPQENRKIFGYRHFL